MPRIANVGSVDWADGVCFTRDAYHAQLRSAITELADFRPIYGMNNDYLRWLDRFEAILLRNELDYNRLALTVRVRFDQPMPTVTEMLPWIVNKGHRRLDEPEDTPVFIPTWMIWNTSLPVDRHLHPLFHIMPGFIFRERFPNVARNNDMTAIIRFHVSEQAVRNPSRYIAALARKMAKWARADQK